MKTILVPTDFSLCAQSAANFAAHLAEKANARLVLLHACHIHPTDAQFMINVTDLVEKEATESLLKERDRLRETYKDMEIHLHHQYGPVSDIVMKYAGDEKADLIVMGTHGADSAIDKMLGSQTYSIVKRSEVPVFAIPETFDIESAQQFIFAWDEHYLSDDLKDQLKDMKDTLGLKFSVLHVSDSIEFGDNTLVQKFMESLDEAPDYDLIVNDDVSKTLQHFGQENTILGIVSHPHGLWKRLTGGSVTKTLLSNARQPLYIMKG